MSRATPVTEISKNVSDEQRCLRRKILTELYHIAVDIEVFRAVWQFVERPLDVTLRQVKQEVSIILRSEASRECHVHVNHKTASRITCHCVLVDHVDRATIRAGFAIVATATAALHERFAHLFQRSVLCRVVHQSVSEGIEAHMDHIHDLVIRHRSWWIDIRLVHRELTGVDELEVDHHSGYILFR
jgi:hypothetical protein